MQSSEIPRFLLLFVFKTHFGAIINIIALLLLKKQHQTQQNSNEKQLNYAITLWQSDDGGVKE